MSEIHIERTVFRGRPAIRMHAMIKASEPVCNLSCDYCRYPCGTGRKQTADHRRIDEATLENFIKQYIGQQSTTRVVFSWQGGEPSLLGIDFFRRVVELQKKHAPAWVKCDNELQTNGTTLTGEWCKFLSENDFLVELSIDGPRRIHDAYRHYADGRGSFDRVMESARLLRNHGVRFATVTAVNDLNARRPGEVYRFLRDEVGSRQMRFVPIVELKDFRDTSTLRGEDMPRENSAEATPGNPASILSPWCVGSEEWGDFLIGVFDEWRRDGLGYVYMPLFDSAIEQWMGHVSPFCAFSPICGKGIAMEHNGEVYACDRNVCPGYRLGNIDETPIDDMTLSAWQQQSGCAKDADLPGKCRQCRYLFACWGECPKNRLLSTDNGQPGLSYLCRGLYKYFSHIDPHIRTIVNQLGYEVSPDIPPV